MPDTNSRFEITISEQVDDTQLTALLGLAGTSVLSEPLPNGHTKITVEGATFKETLDSIRQQLAAAFDKAGTDSRANVVADPFDEYFCGWL